MAHPEVPLISFTGSQPTAERIIHLSAPHCKKLSLELGGKNPAIIFEDANLEECIPTTVKSSFANQVCPLGLFVLFLVSLFLNFVTLSDWICFITVQSQELVGQLVVNSRCYFSERRLLSCVILLTICFISMPICGLVESQLLFSKLLFLSYTAFIRYQPWAK